MPEGKTAPSFLITNYHALTCRDPKQPSMLLPNCPDSPDTIELEVLSREGDFFIYRTVVCDEIATANSTWIEHKDREKGVDLVAHKIMLPSNALTIHLDQLGLDDEIGIEVSQDVFILGYPFDAEMQKFPIWKRGSIASEPGYPVLGLPRILVDTASRPGMSGAPVFVRERNDKVYMSKQQHDLMQAVIEGKAKATEWLDTVDPFALDKTRKRVSDFRFLGIYSGRVGLPDKDLQLGVVWTEKALMEMFKDPVVANHPFPVA